MKKLFGIVPAILLALAVGRAQENPAAKPTDTTEQMLIANERALHDAVARSDSASFVSLVLPDGVWTTTQGFVPMNLLANGLSSFRVTKWDIVNPRVTRLGEDAAVVLYVWSGTGTFDNQPLASATLASTVWTRRNGRWLAVHHQQTQLDKH